MRSRRCGSCEGTFRVAINMSGKFVPYKYYGAEQGVPPLGLPED